MILSKSKERSNKNKARQPLFKNCYNLNNLTSIAQKYSNLVLSDTNLNTYSKIHHLRNKKLPYLPNLQLNSSKFFKKSSLYTLIIE